MLKDICKVLSYTVLILGTLGSIAIANMYGKLLSFMYYGEDRNWMLTISIFIGSMIMVFILTTILYAISNILEKLEEIEYNTYKEEEISIVKGSNTKLDLLAKAVPQTKDTWVCKKCGSTNPLSKSFCKDCGEYR